MLEPVVDAHPGIDGRSGPESAKTARGFPLDVFGRGLMAQFCKSQSCAEAAVLAIGRLAFEQKRQPFAMSEAFAIGARAEVGEGFRHTLTAKRFMLFEGGISSSNSKQQKYTLNWSIRD